MRPDPDTCRDPDILAAEVRRLRERPCPYVTGNVTQYCTLTPFTLTDEELEAVTYYVGTGGPDAVDATLRGLLKRCRNDRVYQSLTLANMTMGDNKE